MSDFDDGAILALREGEFTQERIDEFVRLWNEIALPIKAKFVVVGTDTNISVVEIPKDSPCIVKFHGDSWVQEQLDYVHREFSRNGENKLCVVALPCDMDIQVQEIPTEGPFILMLQGDYWQPEQIDAMHQIFSFDGRGTVIPILEGDNIALIEGENVKDVVGRIAAAMSDADLESVGLKRIVKRDDIFDINRSFA